MMPLLLALSLAGADHLPKALAYNRTLPAYVRLVEILGTEEVIWASRRESERRRRETPSLVAYVDGPVVRVIRRRWPLEAVREREPKPTDFSSATWGGLAGILRHELGHQLYYLVLSEAERARVDLAVAPVTTYARTSKHEAFAEAVALLTHPRYRPDRFAPEARRYLDEVEAVLAGRGILPARPLLLAEDLAWR